MFAYYLLDLKKKKKKLENIPNKYTQTELLLKHGLSEGKTSSWDSRSQFFEPNLICTVTNIRLTRNPVTEELQEKEKINNKNKEIVNMKFKCDQCNFTFKKQITLKKHKNTKHSQPQNRLGVGQFGYVFDVSPGKQNEAKAMREEWRNDDVEAQVLSRAKSSSLSSIKEDDDNDDSEEDEAFFAKYDDDGNFIG